MTEINTSYMAGISDWYDSAVLTVSDWMTSVSNAAGSVVDWTEAQAKTKLTQWRSDLAQLKNYYNQLYNSPVPTDPTLAAERQSLLEGGYGLIQKGNWIESQISSIAQAVGLAGFGFLPLAVPAVAIAAITAVTILIYKFITSVKSYIDKTQYVNAAVAGGKPADQALAEYNAKNQDTGIFGDVSSLLWPVAIIGGLYLFGKNAKR